MAAPHRWAAALLLGVVTAGPAPLPASAQPVTLVDVAARAGVTLRNRSGGLAKDYLVEVNGNGAAFIDIDADDDLDLILVNGSTLEAFARGGDPMLVLYENDGRGGFRDTTAGRGLDQRGWGMGICAADYDNDGARDLYVTAFGPNVLLRNRGDGSFQDETTAAGAGDPGWASNCAFGDYDRDGDLDLYVANYAALDLNAVPARGTGAGCRYMGIAVACGPVGLPAAPDTLFRNDGDGTFTDVSAAAGAAGPAAYGFGVVFADLNDDGWLDLFVANDSQPNHLFSNNGDGTFSEDGLVAGVALSATARAQAGMGVDAGDYDGDGRLDLIVTHFSEDYNTLYANDTGHFFNDVSHAAGLAQASLPFLGWGVGFIDIDNDGLLDVFVANGHVVPEVDAQGLATTYRQRNQLFRNRGNGRFVEIAEAAGGGLAIERSSRGAAFGDYDNDGDVDAVVVNLNDRPTLLRNDTVTANHWIALRLEGTASNRDGVGARLTLEAGGRRQTTEVRSGGSYLSHSDMRRHFGLGGSDTVERLDVRWPNGRVESFDMRALPVDRFYRVREGDGRPLAIEP